MPTSDSPRERTGAELAAETQWLIDDPDRMELQNDPFACLPQILAFLPFSDTLLPWMSLRVKICGLTNLSDTLAAVEAGADALGFMFYEASPRKLSLPMAAQIIRELPPFVARVGVFVDAPEEFIRRAIAECGLDTLQFHGNESPAFCDTFSQKRYKAFRIHDAESLRDLPRYNTSAWLLDSFVPDKAGGTGVKFNWDLACQAKELGRPIILAGGLTPENVAAAVQRVRPFAVDVSSGVESKPGKKDHDKVRAFIQAARMA